MLYLAYNFSKDAKSRFKVKSKFLVELLQTALLFDWKISVGISYKTSHYKTLISNIL